MLGFLFRGTDRERNQDLGWGKGEGGGLLLTVLLI